MLNVNGDQEVPLHESIRMDHCYTNLSGPSSSTFQLTGAVTVGGAVQTLLPQDHVLPANQVEIQQAQPVTSQTVQSQPVVQVLRGKVKLHASVFVFN